MLTTSIPERVRCADSNSLNPVIILIRLFILRWSCSMILFKYLTFRIFIFFVLKLLLFTVKIAELLDPLLSMFTILGFPLLPIALLKNFCATSSVFVQLPRNLLYFHKRNRFNLFGTKKANISAYFSPLKQSICLTYV